MAENDGNSSWQIIIAEDNAKITDQIDLGRYKGSGPGARCLL